MRVFCLPQNVRDTPSQRLLATAQGCDTNVRYRANGDWISVAPSASLHFAFTASQGGLLAQPPLAIPPGTRLRGPAGSLRCSAWQGPAELGSSSLKQAAVLFPANPALLARVNGDWVRAVFTHCNTPDRSHALRPVWRSAEAITALLKHIQRININRPAHLARQRVLFQRRQQHVHQLVQHRALGGLHQ